MQSPNARDPTQPILFCVGGNANFSIFGYQHCWYPQRKIVALGG